MDKDKWIKIRMNEIAIACTSHPIQAIGRELQLLCYIKANKEYEERTT